jgi:hypothetical protein
MTSAQRVIRTLGWNDARIRDLTIARWKSLVVAWWG